MLKEFGLEGRQARWRYELALLQRVQLRLRKPNAPRGDSRGWSEIPCLALSKVLKDESSFWTPSSTASTEGVQTCKQLMFGASLLRRAMVAVPVPWWPYRWRPTCSSCKCRGLLWQRQAWQFFTEFLEIR